MAYKFSKRFFRPKAKSKYKNKKITDSKGNVFDSKKEYERWQTLNMLQSKGYVFNLRRQVKFELIPSYKNIQRGISYYADFTYNDDKGNFVVEDVKSEITRKEPLYVIKKKLLYHIFKIIIREV